MKSIISATLLLLIATLTSAQTPDNTESSSGCTIKAWFEPAPNAPDNSSTIQATSTEMYSSAPCTQICPLVTSDEDDEDTNIDPDTDISEIAFGEGDYEPMKVPQGAKVTKVVCYVGEEVSGTAFGAVEEDDQGNDDPTETESGGAQPTETTETGGAVAMGLGLGFIGVIGVLTVGLVEIF